MLQSMEYCKCMLNSHSLLTYDFWGYLIASAIWTIILLCSYMYIIWMCTMWFVEIIKESLLPYEHGLYEDGFIQENMKALSSSILNLLKGREGYVALEENLRLERDGLVL